MIKVLTIQCHIIKDLETHPKFLVLKRKQNTKWYPGMWQVITGKIESGENPEQTAIREVNEETGQKVNDFWHIPYIGSFYDTRSKAIQNIPIFAATLKNDEIILSDEHTDFKWLDYNEVNEYLALPSHKTAHTFIPEYILDKNKSNFFKISVPKSEQD